MRARRRTADSIGQSSGPRRALRAAVLSLVIALAIAAAGCGGGSATEAPAEPAAGTTEAETTEATTAEATTEGATTGETTTGTSGIVGTLEFGLTEEEFAARVEGVQASIATCMTEAGFEYIPADVETIQLAQLAVRTEPGMDRREYKEQWGFGISTRFDNLVKEIELGSQNMAYYEGLPEADKVAYERTLWGENPDETFAWAFDEEDFSGVGGCTKKAVVANFTKEELSADYINPKDVFIEADPRIIEADANWVTCMQDAGYDGYLDQDEIIDEYEERFDELVGEDDPETLTGPRLDELKQLQEEEIAVSLVDLDCQLEYLDDVYAAVEIELFGHEVSG